MPLTPVAHSVLYLFKAAAMNKLHPLTCPPWTSNMWRELFGLFPLKGSEDYYNVEIDVVGNNPQLDSSKELGLTMPESSIASITKNCWKALGLHECQAAERFLQYFWDTWKADYARKIPICKTIKSTTQGKKGGPDPYRYAAYCNLVLAAINRKGSVMNQVEETLGKIGATLANLWKDDRSLNWRKYENLVWSLKRKVTTSCARMQKVDSKLEGTLEPVVSKSKSKSTQDGPSKKEMQAAYAYYVEEYCYGVGYLDKSKLPVPTVGVSGLHNLVDGCKDIGVSHLKFLSTEVLWAQLGLPGVDQFLFAEPGSGESAKNMALLAKTCVVLFWHQVVGTLRILEGTFTQRVGNCAQPTLLCNNVGLGKTVQIIGVISMIQHYYKQQELPAKEHLATPMFIQAKLAVLCRPKTIPNLPSIVITPWMLGNQWMEQWKKFTQLGSFVPVQYSVESSTLESFCSDPTGPYWAAAGQDLEHAGQVVIIADLLAIAKEAKQCLQLPPAFKGKDAREYKAKGKTPAFKAGISNAGSLFGMCFWVAAVDKIHNIQNSSHTQQGVQLITQSLSLVIGATTTPLFTLLKAKAAKRQKRKQAQDNVGDNEDEDVDENAWNGSQAQGEVEQSNCKNVRWHNFLIEQKFAGMLAKLGVLWLEEQAQELDCSTLTNRVTDNWTVENLPQKMSTRMQCVMGLIEWFWIGNPKPVALLEDGTLDKSRLVQEPLPSKKPWKFLIYMEFQQHQALIAKMLTLKEKDYVTYNGSMATTKCQWSVEKFANNPSCQIMIISNVGSAGLNLVEASVVIIVSSVWSGLELGQIMGCIDCPGQLQDVAVYNIMAPEGIDLALNVCADSKAQFSNHFLSLQRTLQNVYLETAQPHSNDHNELDLEEIPAVPSTKGTKPSASKAGLCKRKSQNEPCSQDANAVQKLALAKALGSQVSGAPSSNCRLLQPR
ncbi:SNF2 family N-terminal domain [Rhizoctonia solani]|uniref:SNF2 family N-terminal domain n=1 Tax=Rhizoctonia solani TaxID=456999 RepID=A0A8H7H1R6_9AGAM|nr:SNF2 family N-terminal domain [Rhizoctonia solani]